MSSAWEQGFHISLLSHPWWNVAENIKHKLFCSARSLWALFSLQSEWKTHIQQLVSSTCPGQGHLIVCFLLFRHHSTETPGISWPPHTFLQPSCFCAKVRRAAFPLVIPPMVICYFERWENKRSPKVTVAFMSLCTYGISSTFLEATSKQLQVRSTRPQIV